MDIDREDRLTGREFAIGLIAVAVILGMMTLAVQGLNWLWS